MIAEQLGEQAAVTDWPLRIVLVALTLAVIALVLFALRRGWRNRERRQGLAVPQITPAVTAAASVLPVTAASYIGTVPRGQQLERVVAGGMRAPAGIVVGDFGILVDKQGDPALLIDHRSIAGVGTAAGMLQRYFGGHGLLMIDWQWAGRPVTTGLWFTDAADQSLVRERIERTHLEGVS